MTNTRTGHVNTGDRPKILFGSAFDQPDQSDRLDVETVQNLRSRLSCRKSSLNSDS